MGEDYSMNTMQGWNLAWCVDGLSPRMGRVTDDVCGPQGLHRDSEPIHKGTGSASPRSSGLFPLMVSLLALFANRKLQGRVA